MATTYFLKEDVVHRMREMIGRPTLGYEWSKGYIAALETILEAIEVEEDAPSKCESKGP